MFSSDGAILVLREGGAGVLPCVVTEGSIGRSRIGVRELPQNLSVYLRPSRTVRAWLIK